MGPLEVLVILSPFLLVGIGYAIGKTVEVRHFNSIIQREQETAGIVLTDLKRPSSIDRAGGARLVIGQAVIGADYFKLFALGMRRLVGGEMRSMTSVMERARREAILRMKEEAVALGAVEICNVRLDTSNILSASGSKNAGVAAEIVAYGTAIIPRPA